MKKTKKIRLPLIPTIMALMFLTGAGIFLYPTVSNYFAEKNASRKVDEYISTVSQLGEETKAREKQKAVEYNEALSGDPVRDPFIEGSGTALPDNYMDVLNINGTMCVIEIPKIFVKLPVYHGTSKAVLDKGIGHIRQTAVPIGGAGNHPVVTGHTGLPDAKLFTDLVKLEKGDIFIIHVLEEKLFYRVDDIAVIIPEDISKLGPIAGLDCVTLVTCTPYGINSHRLLVRGVRAEIPETELETAANKKRGLNEIIIEYSTVFIVIIFIVLLIAVQIIYSSNKPKKKTGAKKQ